MYTKLMKKKTSAMKEILSWVNSSDEYLPSPEVTRNSGQLADNVTEERMLRSKLMELSKERYKFLVQNAYEKKVFSDRQQKKQELRHLFPGQRTPKSAKRALTSFSVKCRPPPGQDVRQHPRSYTSVSWYKATDDVVSRALNVTQNKTEPGGQMAELKPSQGQMAELTPSHVTSDVDIIPGAPILIHPIFTSQKLSVRQIRKTADSVGLSPPTIREARASSTTVTVKPNNAPLSNYNIPERKLMNDNDIKQKTFNAKETNKIYGERVYNKTSDPRYDCLVQVLCPAVSKENIDVESIVHKIESLRVRPKKIITELKKDKIGFKAMEYMRSKGYGL